MRSDASESGDALRDRIRSVLVGQKQPTVTVLSSLLAIQDDIRYLPNAAIEETAAYLDSTVNEVWSVASFYTNFRFTPPGQHEVEVCWGPSCHILGAQAVLEAVQDELALDHEGETEDGALTLRYSTCLGACALAPVIAIDDHHTGRMTPGAAAKAVADLRRQVASQSARSNVDTP